MLTIDFDRFRVRPGMTALDIGCGRGRHSLEFFRRGCRTLAMDLQPADLRYSLFLLTNMKRGCTVDNIAVDNTAADHAAVEPPATEMEGGPAAPFAVLRADALRLPFQGGRFDRVVCSEVLEHVDEPRRAVAEIARVLRPGGMMAASVPTSVTEWANRFASDDYFNTPGGHVRIFTARRLFGLLADGGLDVVDIHFEHAFHSLYWWTRGVFGLHDESHVVIRHFRKVLTHVMFSRLLTRIERGCNTIFPKSMVIYARKRPGNGGMTPQDSDGGTA